MSDASSDCVFCRIVRGEVPSAKVFENEHVLAFLDIAPIAPGHTLMIPKRHVDDLLTASADVAAELARCLPWLAAAVCRATGADGLHVMQLNGRAAGQVVMHLHVHLIPRSASDGVQLLIPKGGRYKGEQMHQMAAAIARKLHAAGDGP